MEEKKATQTAIYSEYVGTVQEANKTKPTKTSVEKAKLAGPEKYDWRKNVYPNHKKRRAFEDKGNKKYARTKIELEDGVTPFQKRCQVLRARIERGVRIDQAFQNDIAQDSMHIERAIQQNVMASLYKALGREKGKAAYDNNRRLQAIREDKKIAM